MRKDAYYFPHDSNAKDDPKCMMLIEQLGLEGYGIFWVLVETLRDQPNYKYPVKLLPAIARRYNTTFEKVKTVVYNYGLFFIEDNEIFFSYSLIERMNAMDYNRISGIKGALKRHRYLTKEQLEKMSDSQILDYYELVKNKQVSPLNSPLDSPPLPLKGKESKENKNKENIIEFDTFWELYDYKKDRKKCETKWNKINLETQQKIIDYLPSYIESTPDKKFRKHPATFLNNESWNNEITENKTTEQKYKEHYKLNENNINAKNYAYMLRMKKDILYQFDEIITINEFSKLNLNGNLEKIIIAFQNYGKSKTEFLTNLGIHVRKY